MTASLPTKCCVAYLRYWRRELQQSPRSEVDAACQGKDALLQIGIEKKQRTLTVNVRQRSSEVATMMTTRVRRGAVDHRIGR